MAYFLFKCWKEKLFSVERHNIVPHKNESLTFVPITVENSYLVKDLRDKMYEGQFLYQLSCGDCGYYAYLNGKPVGYGWAKHEGSDDYFFRISRGVCYLCRFFVHESVRGRGIYPAIITALTEKEQDIQKFYIAVEEGNTSSENGLKKVGFEYVKTFGFIRGFKHTFNKKRLV